MASGAIMKSPKFEALIITPSNSTITTNYGEVVTCELYIIHERDYVLNVGRFLLRLKNLNVNEIPTITIKNDAFKALGGFAEGIPVGARGAAGSPVPTDGGQIAHTAGSDTVTISFFNYIASQPAGYLNCVR